MAPKVAVVTGSNKGIGYAIVKNLCEQFDGTVYLTARDAGRGQSAVQSLNKLGLKPEFHLLDVDSDESVKAFAAFIEKKHGGIDVLVNNAAIAFKSHSPEAFGHQAEVTLRTNYFSVLRVCSALFPLLRDHARVVNMTSCLGHLLQIPGDRLRQELADPALTESQLTALMNAFIQDAKRGDYSKKGWPHNCYAVSKVGVSALTRIQHKQILGDPRQDIVINCVHPGYVDTDMTDHMGPLTVEQGADAPTYLALLPKGVVSPKGDYVWNDRTIVDWVKGPVPGPF